MWPFNRRQQTKYKVSVLVGMDIISKGDFSLTSVNGKTEMKFRIPPQGHIGK